MELDVSLNFKEKIEDRKEALKLIEELNDVLYNKDINAKTKINNIESLNNNEYIDKHCKEGHLYLVEEDINNKIYLWDLTDKPNYSFEAKNFPKELMDKAKEGAVFQYINGSYIYYSDDGFERI